MKSLVHEFSMTGLIARQSLLMADQECNCWLFLLVINSMGGEGRGGEGRGGEGRGGEGRGGEGRGGEGRGGEG